MTANSIGTINNCRLEVNHFFNHLLYGLGYDIVTTLDSPDNGIGGSLGPLDQVNVQRKPLTVQSRQQNHQKVLLGHLYQRVQHGGIRGYNPGICLIGSLGHNEVSQLGAHLDIGRLEGSTG